MAGDANRRSASRVSTPLFFNPFLMVTSSPTRVVLFLVIVLGMLLFRIAAQAATLSPSPGSDHHAETRRLNLVNLWRSNPLAIPAMVYGLVYLSQLLCQQLLGSAGSVTETFTV